jgi:hypothetical protein
MRLRSRLFARRLFAFRDSGGGILRRAWVNLDVLRGVSLSAQGMVMAAL